jgi:putative transport protein
MLHFYLSMKSPSQTLLALGLVIILGLALGKLKIKNISLGVGGVLFAGLLGGHILSTIGPVSDVLVLNKEILELLREFGLVLFVYTIGMQVGPGFFASLKKSGLFLNSMAAVIVVLGVATAGIIHVVDRERIPVEIAVGLLSGATTNTPGLGAAQQVLSEVFSHKKTLDAQPSATVPANLIESSALSYSISYPFGILGIILAMILLRLMFKINPVKSAQHFERDLGTLKPEIINVNLEVKNQAALGLKIAELSRLAGNSISISRHLHSGEIDVAYPQRVLQVGDLIHAVGPKNQIEKLIELTGPISLIDLRKMDSDLISRRILITEKQVLGKTIESLDLHNQRGVTITRVVRAGVEFSRDEALKLQYGDIVMAVGPKEAIAQVASLLGDCVQKYNHPLLISLFTGLVLGCILGSIPINLGMPVPLKLGLAGGPLLVSILLSRIGRIGQAVFHIPMSANLWIREMGIAVFLACVGIMSGGKFVNTLLYGNGLYWMLMGALITFVPLFLVGFGVRYFFKTNYMQLCGLLAGSMTDPPALAFANGITQSNGPAVTYATVYPLVMLLRIISVQIFVIFFSS